MQKTIRNQDYLGKENINSNIQESEEASLRASSREGRRKRTAHFANIKQEFGEHQRSPSISEADPPYSHHEKTYSYLNSANDNESPGKESYIVSPVEEDSEFEFGANLRDSEISP